MMESKNCSGLKYGTYKIFDIFSLISFNWDQNIGTKKNYNKIWVLFILGGTP
jgi:hypothetical protein